MNISQNSKNSINWTQKVTEQADKWGHVVFKITGEPSSVSRRSFVLWQCSQHPDGGTNVFAERDSTLEKLINNPKVRFTRKDAKELIERYPGEPFYCTRMDYYVPQYKKERTTCCREKLHGDRKIEGYHLFCELLKARGKHYKTEYTLLIDSTQYNGKAVKYPIRCEAHKTEFRYSMKDLTTITSCPCPTCRRDPKHKNKSVEIVKRRNGGRPGQIIRHARGPKAP